MATHYIIPKLQKALERGTGDAYFIVKNNLEIDFTLPILKAATNCYGYDPHCEGRRAEYLYAIIDLLPQNKVLSDTILCEMAFDSNSDIRTLHQTITQNP